MVWLQLIPADVERDEGLLCFDYFAEINHAEVIQSGLYQRQFAEGVTLTHTLHQLVGGPPHALGVNQVQLLEVVWHSSLQHWYDCIGGLLIHLVILDRQDVQMPLVAQSLADGACLDPVHAVAVEVELADEVLMVHEIVAQTPRVTRVELQVAQDELPVHYLAQEGLCDRVCLDALIVILHQRVIKLRIGEFTVFGHLT